MAKLGINTGSSADDGTGDSLKVGAGKINSNFNEVYSLLTGAGNNGNTLLSGIVTSITAGSNITLSGGPTGAIEITAAALTGTGFWTNNSTGIHTLGSVGIGTTTAENNGLSVPLGNVFVGKGVTTLNLNVAGVTTFSGGDINISGDNYTAMWDASVDTLEFADNAKIAFGDGSDLTLYHDANDSWVKDQATGNLYLDSNGAAVKITKAGAAETMAEFNTDGPVKLFHNNVRVLETVSTGATVVGDLYVGGDLFVLDDVTYNEMNSVNLNVSGVSTFGGTSNLNGDLRVGVSTLFADVSTGRVGVGTDVPGDLFFVDGSLTASGLSTFSGGLKSLEDVTVGLAGAGNTFFVDVSTGRVGVRTDAMTEAFEVNGNAHFKGNLTLKTTATSELTRTLQVGSAILQGGGDSVSLTNNFNNGDIKIAMDDDFYVTNYGNVKILEVRTAYTNSEDNSGHVRLNYKKSGATEITELRLETKEEGVDLYGFIDVADATDDKARIRVGSGVTINATGINASGPSNAGVVTATTFVGSLTGTSIEVTNIVGAAASIAGIVTATTFIGALTGNASGSSGSCTGNSVTATDLAINATNRLVIQTGNNATDILAAGNSGEYLISAGSGSAPTWSSALTTTKIRAANYALGNVFAHRVASFAYNGSMVQSFFLA